MERKNQTSGRDTLKQVKVTKCQKYLVIIWCTKIELMKNIWNSELQMFMLF